MSQKKTLKGKNLSTAKYKTKANLVWGFTISFFSVSLLGSIALISYSSIDHNNVFTEQVHSNLEEIAEISSSHVETFLKGKKERVVDFASDGFIKDSLKELIDNALSEEIMQKLSKHLIDNKIIVDESFYEIIVLDSFGRVVGTTHIQEELGNDFSQDLIFVKGRKSPYIRESFYDEEFNRNGIILSAPIVDKEFLGVVIIRMSLERLIEIISGAGEFNENGQVYIIDNDSFMLTPSKFLRGENKGILTQEVNTENSENCLKDIEIYSSNAEGLRKRGKEPISFLDYRGERVIGTHRHILGTKWCLLAEIDEEKTLDTPVRKFVSNQIFVSAILILSIASVGFFIGRFFNRNFVIQNKIK